MLLEPFSSDPPSVVVVGAGAAGITSAYHLHRAGASITVLEASSRIGGRLKKDTSLTDFPLDLGGQWIGFDPSSTLNGLLGTVKMSPGVQDTLLHEVLPALRVDADKNVHLCEDSKPIGHKWVNSTWYDFFHRNMVVRLRDKIICNSVVDTIETSKRQVRILCGDKVYIADHVIVTVNMKALQEDRIRFVPSLPDKYNNALPKFHMEPALKVFLKFSYKFYPRSFYFDSNDEVGDESLYYFDDSFGEETRSNILGFFGFGRPVKRYLELCKQGEDLLIDTMLNELDEIFENQATPNYQGHVLQDWSQERFCHTGYANQIDDTKATISLFQTPIDNKLYFAGDSLPRDLQYWGYANVAADSGLLAAQRIHKLYQQRRRSPVLAPVSKNRLK